MKLKMAAAACALILASCGSAREDFAPANARPDRSVELTPQERIDLLVNELFHAVYNNLPEESARLAASNPALLRDRNAEGDTALGFALARGLRTPALRLLEITSVGDLFHLNSKGESYIYLAARAGFAGAITAMADKYYNSLGTGEDYEFSDLDQETPEGRRALFVAADRLVAEALEVQYHRGLTEVAGMNFTLQTDNHSHTFLHAAAADGRDDVILWAAEDLCGANSWETDPSAWYRIPGKVFGVLTSGLPSDVMFNRYDEDYQTALHAAINNRRWSSVRAIAHCRWVNYDAADAQGNTALHAFLKALNPFRPQQDEEVRATFAFLLEKNTKLSFTTTDERAGYINVEGDTPLHLAAKMADPYFYTALAKYGDVNALNAKGASARHIFENRQKQAPHAH